MKKSKKLFAIFASITMIICLLSDVRTVSAAMAEYEIYPTPHKIAYKNNTFILRDKVNVVYEEGIDSYTKNRLEEITKLKGQTISTSDAVIDPETEQVTNIVVGIYDSKQYVDNYVKDNYSIGTSGLFNKLDSYYLTVDNGTIVILGKDTDAAFYGLTTLYHIYAQLESKTIRDFTIEDYADVASRGFIEGYYGNPWSVEDRQELMEWGGYYKLNSYFYAPKDDPKHNAKWRELYTQDELDTKIKPLAQAGNESKCRFVFALHPYMNNAIRYDSEANYQQDLAIMQAKFSQVIDAGVRQIAILADDAGNVGAANYTKTLKDMSDWLKEKQKTYPDLKLTLPFCTQEYMGNGQSYYSNFPDNVQIVMTGGTVWGQVSNNFTTTFTNNVGRGPYLWINWPCTDNSKQHLIMGGYDTFLHPGVNPGKIQGIVLNPMQQSEPSKVAIFGNACYSWNVWEDKNEADKAWADSFKYVDHNSALETEASNALKELSKHMINQNMDGRVAVLQESVELKTKLDNLKNKLSTNSVSEAQIDELISEFTLLQDSAKTYRNKAGDKRVKNQINDWLNCWDDTTISAISYLNALKAFVNGDNTTLLNQYTEGQKAYAQSKTYGFHYVDHTEYAEVGVQHIVPFIKTLGSYLSNQVKSIANPNIITKTYISNSFTNPASGSTDNVFDENDSTTMEFHNPNYIYKDDYIGVMFNRGTEVNSIRFLMGGGKNHLYKSKLQYTTDGTTWVDVNGTIYNRPNGSTEAIEEKNLSLTNVKGVRLLCTENNGADAWLNIASIDINKKEKKESYYPIQSIQNSSDIVVADPAHPLTKAIDRDKTSETWLKKIVGDAIPNGATVTVDLGSSKQIGSVYMAQSTSSSTDFINNGVIEYSNDNSTWTTYGNVTSAKEQTITGQKVMARYIRVRNTEAKNIWWRLAEIQVNAPTSNTNPISYTVIKTDRWVEQTANPSSLLYDNNDNTFAWFDPDGGGNTTSDTAMAGDYLGYDLGKIAQLQSAHIVVGADNGDKILKFAIETSITGGTNANDWTAIPGYESYNGTASGKDNLDIPLNGLQAKYIRIRNLENRKAWVKFSEFTVKEIPTGDSKHLYTNVSTPILSNVSEAGDMASLTAGSVTLAQNDYIGLQLDTIKDLDKITTDINLASSNLKLQISKNALIWTDVATGTQTNDARYIRIINTGSSTSSLTFNEFKVTSHEVKRTSLNSSNIPVTGGWGDTRNNGFAFDGNISTTNKFGGNPSKGQYIIYDLGQSINITSLRTYVQDVETDFIRDAKFQISDNLTNWQDAFAIGDGVTDTDRESPARNSSVFQNTDSNYPNYLYEGNDSLNLTGRYLRILMTADYPQRAVNINEIIINRGAYIPVENNREFIGALEERGHQPSLMSDNDLTTTYKSSIKNSMITYFISKTDGLKTFRIIQNGAITHASVKATFFTPSVSRSGETTETITVGNLDQSINDYLIPDGKQLISVEIEWGEQIPEISEIILSKNSVAVVDKTVLNTELAKIADSRWTKKSIDAFNASKTTAQGIADSQYYTQDAIDSAVSLLQMTYKNAELKADINAFSDVINKAILNDNEYYSVRSYQNYDAKLLVMKTALADRDNLSQTAATQMIADLEIAKNGLAYSIQFREEAQLALSDDKTFASTYYSASTYKAYTDAKDALKQAIKDDETAIDESHRILPSDMVIMTNAFKTSISLLADITELRNRVNEFDNYDVSIYTKDTFNAYKEAIEDGKTLLISGTKDEVDKQVIKIDNKRDSLSLDTLVPLNKVIEDALKANKDDYTELSYDNLMMIIKDAQDLVNPSDAQVQEYITKIASAKKDLISIVVLKQRVSDAQTFDKNQYTKQSYKELEAAILNAKKQMKNGGKEDVNQAFDTLNQAIQSLTLSGAKELKEYVQAIQLLNPFYYTSESYQEYLAAYNQLKSLSDEVSLKEFYDAKANFEKYITLLKLKKADYSQIESLISQIPSHLENYDSHKVQVLKQVIASILYDKTINEQDIVDGYAKELYRALQEVLNSNHNVQTNDTTSILGTVMILLIAGYGFIALKRKKED